MPRLLLGATKKENVSVLSDLFSLCAVVRILKYSFSWSSRCTFMISVWEEPFTRRFWRRAAYCLFMKVIDNLSVVAATAEHDNDSEDYDPRAVVVEDVA